jgi:hypothetical protein
MAGGQPSVVEQRHHEGDPASAKHTDQAEAHGAALTASLRRQRGDIEQGRGRNSFLGLTPHTERPQGGHRHGQPSVRRPLGIGDAGALPLPPAPLGNR